MNKTITTPKRAKPAFDMGASLKALVNNSETAADNRFAVAREIVAHQPSAVNGSPVMEARSPTVNGFLGKQIAPSDVASFEVGQTYTVPIDLIDSNPHGARVFYRVEDTDEIGKSMKAEGQFVAVNGFVKGHRIELVDGETRLRAARAYGIHTLQVKVEPTPKDAIEQYTRSALLNNKRRNHKSLDVAVRMRTLLETGAYASQDAIAGAFIDEKGNGLSKSQVSMYMRISRIPERFLQKMSHADNTSAFSAAYEISGIFESADYVANSEKYDAIATEIIEDVQDKSLSFLQIKALISSKLKGPRSRKRAESMAVKYGTSKGFLKVFPEGGRLELSFNQLPEDKLAELRDLVEKMLAGQLSI